MSKIDGIDTKVNKCIAYKQKLASTKRVKHHFLFLDIFLVTYRKNFFRTATIKINICGNVNCAKIFNGLEYNGLQY